MKKHKHEGNQKHMEENNNPFENLDENFQDNEQENKNQEIKNDENVSVKDDIGACSKDDYEKLHNQYLRLAADFDNYRKRQAQERENLLNYGKIEALTKLLEVLDNFDRAEKSLKDNEDCTQIKEAFKLLYKQVFETMQKMGLQIVETEGKEFNPNFHDAVMQTPTGDYPDQTIINELQKGYSLGDKVLRPALVNVAVAD